MPNPFLDYYRCPGPFADFGIKGDLSSEAGYFSFHDATCYGRRPGAAGAKCMTPALPDASPDVDFAGGRVRLPFDLSEVVTNLREERYHQNSRTMLSKAIAAGAAQNIYYFFRPILPVAMRKHLQRIYLSGWEKIAFPRWPVDTTIELLMQGAMKSALEVSGKQTIPFIWFWPNGATGAAMITHDVEGPAGQEFCTELMNIDDAFG